MDDTKNESKHLLNTNPDQKFKDDNINCKLVETCKIEQGKVICKSTEEFTENECDKNIDTVLLPSTVIDREEIFFPNNITKDDPSIYGKWLIFTNGDFKLQDYLWIQLQSLFKNSDLILLESSTAKKGVKYGPLQGVIKCYTCKDINVIKRAGLSIQEILENDTILNYKTNEASRNNLYVANESKFISKFMLTVDGELYMRDQLCRWIEITDVECRNFTFGEKYPENDDKHDFLFARRKLLESGIDTILLPSTVIDQEEIFFPDNIAKDDPSIYGKWLIFTNGDLELQDYLWILLQSLFKNSDFILLESTTAKEGVYYGPLQGVIKCYTCKDINVIKCAGQSIQKILKNDTILNYKTNEASRKNLYVANENKFISKFMLTVDGKLHMRDQLCRWIEITDAECQNFTFEEKYPENDDKHDSLFAKRKKLETERNRKERNKKCTRRKWKRKKQEMDKKEMEKNLTQQN